MKIQYSSAKQAAGARRGNCFKHLTRIDAKSTTDRHELDDVP